MNTDNAAFKNVIHPIVVKFVTRLKYILCEKLETKDIEIKFSYKQNWLVTGQLVTKNGIQKIVPTNGHVSGVLSLTHNNMVYQIPTSGKLETSGRKHYFVWDTDLSIPRLTNMLTNNESV